MSIMLKYVLMFVLETYTKHVKSGQSEVCIKGKKKYEKIRE